MPGSTITGLLASDFAYDYVDDGERGRLSRGDDVVYFDTERVRVRRWMDARHADGDMHEPWFAYSLARLVEVLDPRVYFDVGAFLGYFSVLPLTWLHRDARVFAFEMNPASHRHLVANLACNHHLAPWRVFPILAGLSDEVALAEPVVVDAFALNRPEHPDEATDHIDILTLDHLAAVAGFVPDLIKMDVEGFEAAIVRGGMEVLATAMPTMLFELHSEEMLAARGGTRAGVLSTLEGVGYQMFVVQGGRNDQVLRDRPLVRMTAANRDEAVSKANSGFVAVAPDRAHLVEQLAA